MYFACTCNMVPYVGLNLVISLCLSRFCGDSVIFSASDQLLKVLTMSTSRLQFASRGVAVSFANPRNHFLLLTAVTPKLQWCHIGIRVECKPQVCEAVEAPSSASKHICEDQRLKFQWEISIQCATELGGALVMYCSGCACHSFSTILVLRSGSASALLATHH